MATANNTSDESTEMEEYECVTCGGRVDGSSLLCGGCYAKGQQTALHLPPAPDGGHRFTAP